MSHQAGIKACDDLRAFLGNCKKADIRLVQIAIRDEQLVLEHSSKVKSTWENDWDSMLLPRLEKDKPAYFMMRLDEKSSFGYLWVFISYSPDFSPVRQKMLYAATKATLRMEFGSSQIKEDLFGTVPSDIDLDGYKKHQASAKAPKPLTQAEEELVYIRQNEVNTDIGVNTRQQTVQRISFPVSQPAVTQLNNLKNSTINYVQLSFNVANESIDLADHGNFTVPEMQQRVPTDHGRYHVYCFEHEFEGDVQKPIIFLYTMPGYTCPIKERMLYSSAKAPLLDFIEGSLNIPIDKKLEIGEIEEVTHETFYSELHPVKNVPRKMVEKPRPPGNRGARRIIHTEQD